MQTFSEFLKKKRHSLGMTEREFAKLIGASPFTLRRMEEGSFLKPHQKPSQSELKYIAQVLNLHDDEKELFFELAEKYKENITQSVTPILDYIHDNQSVRKVLKAGREAGLTNNDWEKIADEIIKRKTGCDEI